MKVTIKSKEMLLASAVVVFFLATAGPYLLSTLGLRLHQNRVHVGLGLPVVPSYRWADHPLTVLLALHVGCPYCEHSIPFYQKLIRLEQSQRSVGHVAAFFPDPTREVIEDYGSLLRGAEMVPETNFTDLRIAATPTIYLVDQNGTVRDGWIGELSTDQQDLILRKLTTADKTCSEESPLPCGR